MVGANRWPVHALASVATLVLGMDFQMLSAQLAAMDSPAVPGLFPPRAIPTAPTAHKKSHSMSLHRHAMTLT